MSEFIKISNSFRWSIDKDEVIDGFVYINIQSIISIEVYRSNIDEMLCTIKTIDAEVDKGFKFKYEENHPEWVALFSRLNK